MSYTRGSKVVLWADLTIEETGAPVQDTDFDDIIVTVVDGLGVTTLYLFSDGAVVGDTSKPGRYSVVVDTEPAAGNWQYQFDTTGPNAIVEKRQFTVKDRLAVA